MACERRSPLTLSFSALSEWMDAHERQPGSISRALDRTSDAVSAHAGHDPWRKEKGLRPRRRQGRGSRGSGSLRSPAPAALTPCPRRPHSRRRAGVQGGLNPINERTTIRYADPGSSAGGRRRGRLQAVAAYRDAGTCPASRARRADNPRVPGAPRIPACPP